MDKEQLRKIALNRRDAIEDSLRERWSEDITDQLEQLLSFRKATRSEERRVGKECT